MEEPNRSQLPMTPLDRRRRAGCRFELKLIVQGRCTGAAIREVVSDGVQKHHCALNAGTHPELKRLESGRLRAVRLLTQILRFLTHNTSVRTRLQPSSKGLSEREECIKHHPLWLSAGADLPRSLLGIPSGILGPAVLCGTDKVHRILAEAISETFQNSAARNSFGSGRQMSTDPRRVIRAEACKAAFTRTLLRYRKSTG